MKDDTVPNDNATTTINNTTNNVVTVIHCWSAPRSRSTALLYSFEARNNHHQNDTTTTTTASSSSSSSNTNDDITSSTSTSNNNNMNTIVMDEPLYALWLLQQVQQQGSSSSSSNKSMTPEITRPYLPYVMAAAAAASTTSTTTTTTTSDTNDINHQLDPTILKQWVYELLPIKEKIRRAVQTLYTTTTSSSNNNNNNNTPKVIFCKHIGKFWSVYNRTIDEEDSITISSSSTTDTNDTTTTINYNMNVQIQHYHILLIRHPMDVVTSWNAIGTMVHNIGDSNNNNNNNNNNNSSTSSTITSTTTTNNSDENNNNNNNDAHIIHEIGILSLLQIYTSLLSSLSSLSSPLVIHADELIQDPQSTLQRICSYCHDIPYYTSMMSWKSGPHQCDGPWAQYWYHDVHKTTGWIASSSSLSDNIQNEKKTKKYRTMNPMYWNAIQASYPAYTYLYQYTQLYQNRTTLSKEQLYSDDIRNERLYVYISTSPGIGQCIPRNIAGISPFDSTVQGGDATWEGIRVYRGKILCLEKHIQRLMHSAKALGFNMDRTHSKEQVIDAIFQVLAINGMRDGAHMRLTLSRGEKCTSSMNPNFNVYGTTLIILPEWKPVHGITTYDNSKGISLITASQRRHSPGTLDSKIHHNNLLNNILPKIQANLAGCADAIMLDIDGYVSETNATNIFMINDDGILLTPSADHCLPGITRSAVLAIAKEIHIPIEIRRISLTEFYTAAEVFTTGTMGELTPVIQIDGRMIGNSNNNNIGCGPITKQLQDVYQTLPDRDGWSTPIPPFE